MLIKTILIVAVLLPVIVCTSDEGRETYTEVRVDYLDYGLINTTRNEQFLSAVQIPFRVQLSSREDVEKLVRATRFMDAARGQCSLLSCWELICMVFESTSPEEKYGLRHLDTVRQLMSEGMINENTANNEVEYTGLFELRLPESEKVLLAHVSDIVLKVHFGQKSILHVNIASMLLRQKNYEKMRKIKAYTQSLEKTHMSLRRLQRESIIRERQRHLNETLKREKQLAMMREGALKLRRRNRTKHTARYDVDYERPVISLVSSDEEDRIVSVNSKAHCKNIRHAIQTLQRQHVVPLDRRLQYLRKKEKEKCGAMASAVTDFFPLDGNELCDSRCIPYCEGVQNLENWMKYTGSAVSIIQIQSLYHNILLSNTDFNDSAKNYFFRLRKLVLDDMDRSIFSTCNELCVPSNKLLSGMKFFAGILEILDDPVENKTGLPDSEIHSIWWSRVTRAYLHIWEASHFASQRATTALVTMKEHGIFSRRESRVPAVLLAKVLSERQIYFWRQVMDRRVINSEEGAAVPSAEKMLRFERFFALENSWSGVNEPFLTRNRVKSINSEIDGNEDKENNVEEGELSTNVLRSFWAAQMHIAGIKGMTRDLKRSECLLLLVLRKLRYMCDVAHPENLDKEYFSKNGRGGGCNEHLEQLHVLREDGGVPLGPCALLNGLNGTPHQSSLRFIMRSKKILQLVHKTLVLLAYVQLLNGLQYDLAAKYAFLAVEVSAAAFHSALLDLPSDFEQMFLVGDLSKNESFDMLKNASWTVMELLTHALSRRGDPSDSLLDFTRSGFVSSESLVLLAMTSLRGNETAQKQYDSFATERFFGANPCLEEKNKASCRIQRTFFLLWEAARLWGDEVNIPGILDSTYPSPRRVDAFLLMASLLKSGKITVEDVRDGNIFLSPKYTPRSLPSVGPTWSDTSESFRRKLLRFVETISPLTLPGGPAVKVVYAKNWNEFLTRGVSLLELHVLRMALQVFLDDHDMNPLLVVSDVHDYLDNTRWSWLQTFFGTLWNAVLYLFTQTQVEVLEERMVEEILPKNKKMNFESVVNIAEQLAESIFNSRHVREVTIALQLLGTTLISGEPDGFTLILLEEMERGNSYLRSFAHFISEHVWGNSLAEVWMEEHKVAQWNHIKPKTKGKGPIFSVNPKIPFSYALSDSRMELFTQISLKRVKTREEYIKLLHDHDHGGMSGTGNATILLKINKEIIHTLALCSGVLIDVAIHEKHPFPPLKPYDGMYFPVGSPLCLQRLMQLVHSTGISPFSGLRTKDRAELSLLDLLIELVKTQGRYYDLSLSLININLGNDGDHGRGDGADVKKIRKHLVEPWRKLDHVVTEEISLPEVGEGAFYNKRLHRVTGLYYAARVLRLYIRAKLWLNNLLGFV